MASLRLREFWHLVSIASVLLWPVGLPRQRLATPSAAVLRTSRTPAVRAAVPGEGPRAVRVRDDPCAVALGESMVAARPPDGRGRARGSGWAPGQAWMPDGGRMVAHRGMALALCVAATSLAGPGDASSAAVGPTTVSSCDQAPLARALAKGGTVEYTVDCTVNFTPSL